jgi:hypothetical protein
MTPDIKRRLVAAVLERAAWRAGLAKAHAEHDPRNAASRDALRSLAGELENVDDGDPRWADLVDLDLEEPTTRGFVARCGYSERGGAAAQDAEGFLRQLLQVTNISRNKRQA